MAGRQYSDVGHSGSSSAGRDSVSHVKYDKIASFQKEAEGVGAGWNFK